MQVVYLVTTNQAVATLFVFLFAYFGLIWYYIYRDKELMSSSYSVQEAAKRTLNLIQEHLPNSKEN